MFDTGKHSLLQLHISANYQFTNSSMILYCVETYFLYFETALCVTKQHTCLASPYFDRKNLFKNNNVLFILILRYDDNVYIKSYGKC